MVKRLTLILSLKKVLKMNRAASITRAFILGIWYITRVLFKIIACIVYVFIVALYYASRGV